MNTNISSLRWKDFTFPINKNTIFTFNLVEQFLNNFNKEILEQLNDNEQIHLFFKIKYDQLGYRNMSQLITLNKKDIYLLLKIIRITYNQWYNQYEGQEILELIINYKLVDPNIIPKYKDMNDSNNESPNCKFTFNGKAYHYPNTMDIFTWGTLHQQDNNHYIILNNDKQS